jgi:THO complex subunit 2
MQSAALEMQKKERVASEEAEKRLKAALTAKREPSGPSRVSSPAVAEPTTPADPSGEAKTAAPSEDVAMDGTDNTEAAPTSVEVRNDVVGLGQSLFHT